MFKRTFTCLLLLFSVIALQSVVYAQTGITCGLSTPLGPTSVATATGHTEPIAAGFNALPPAAGGGTVRVTCTNNGATVDPGFVTLTVSLGVPVTNTTSHPTASTGIRLGNGSNGAVAPTGDFANGNVFIASVNNSAGTITIGLGTPPSTGITFTAGATSTFDLAGVLVSAFGQTGPISANLQSSGGVGISNGVAQVISAILPGLQDPTVPPALPPSVGDPASGGPAVLTPTVTLKDNFTIRIQENYPGMFRTANQFNGPGIGGVFPPSPSASVQLILVFHDIPSGLSISNCFAVLTDGAGNPTSGTPVLSNTSVTPVFSIIVAAFSTVDLNLNNLDAVWLTCTVARGTANVILPMTPVTAQATLGPLGIALPASLTSLTTGQVPRYQQLLQPTALLPVVTFTEAPPVPAITGITPLAGTQGTTINAIATGINLTGASIVTFSGMGVTASVGGGGTDTSLPLKITITAAAPVGGRTVTVTAPGGTSDPFSSFTVTPNAVLAWGSNTFGQLGHENPAGNLVPQTVTDFGPGSNTVAIAGGSIHTLALKSDGSVFAWGANSSGQVGDGTMVPKLFPTQVVGLGAGSGVIAIAAGNTFSLALKEDGTVLAWGSNGSGQLGDGTLISKPTPVQVSGLGPGSGVIAIAASFSGLIGAHSMALKSDGTVLAWGFNSTGQLGDSSTVSKSVPVQVTGLGPGSGVIAIAAGGTHSLALKGDGTVLAWGANGNGQLGLGNMTSSNVPIPLPAFGPGSGIAGVAASNGSSLALKSEGSVWGWGANFSGQLGDGSTTQRLSPVQVKDSFGTGFLSGITGIAAGNTHSLALDLNGTLWAFGLNLNGQVGDGTTTNRNLPVAVTGLGVPSGVLHITGGGSFSAALKNDGTTLTWGSNSSGQLGNGNYDGSALPLLLDDSSETVAVSTGPGSLHNLLLKGDGSVLAWGSNTFGQLGDGTNISKIAPVLVTGFGSGSGIIAIATASSHSLALRSDGTVFTWGLNSNGQLGDNTVISKNAPVQVNGLGPGSGIVAIAAGGSHSLALKADGTVWAWGLNTNGQLGDGTTIQKLVPFQVSPLTGLISSVGIAAGVSHSLAINYDGTLFAWGLNTSGQLGSGPSIQQTSPVPVLNSTGSGQLSGSMAVAAGTSHSLMLSTDGTVYAWGLNTSGQLGDGTTTSRNIPVQVTSLGPGSGVLKLVAGASHSLAMREAEVLVWGANPSGQLGDGTLANQFAPVKAVLPRAFALAGGSTHSLALGTVPDPTPPVVTPSIIGTLGNNGWYRSDVTVSWSVSDPETNIVSSTGCGVTDLTSDTAGTKLTCTAVNAAGLNQSVSVTIKIDTTKPLASANVSPLPNANGWYNANVTVSFTGTDNLSGIAGCSSAVVLSSNGSNQSASGSCTDNAGNVSLPATASGINIDKVPPTISGMPAAGCTIWPPTLQLVGIADIRFSDLGSGIDPASVSIRVTSNEPVDPSDIVVTGGTVQVRADRLGAGKGRTYSVIAQAADLAGNSTMANGSCFVPHDVSH
jgi:alpha-tubulin suppressor-like RCC1 family protein